MKQQEDLHRLAIVGMTIGLIATALTIIWFGLKTAIIIFLYIWATNAVREVRAKTGHL
ncbi:hypothetical protein UFOVP594_42 [uncultured Caudovirales phage]|uniref:Uncharacterized protein n=1 Tax=uncultured Caudovirales phage TaxID=2100421 RepID=A0A6J5MYN4_9CAUD|nr:hypothetical protein UFOVP594_42 [uncultured Caudovirales phage]